MRHTARRLENNGLAVAKFEAKFLFEDLAHSFRYIVRRAIRDASDARKMVEEEKEEGVQR